MTSHGWRYAASTFPACRSVHSSTQRPAVPGSAREQLHPAASAGSRAPWPAESRSENCPAGRAFTRDTPQGRHGLNALLQLDKIKCHTSPACWLQRSAIADAIH